MKTSALAQEGYQLFHEGIAAFSKMEATGIRVDTRRLKQTKSELPVKIRELKSKVEGSDVWRIWKKRFGLRASLTSRDQLAKVLHEEMGFEVKATTNSGKPSVDEEALQDVDHPILPDLVRMLKYEKALGTFLAGIEREVDTEGRLHPSFNLHLARSYRSSSDSPNFQNFPVRDKEISEIIRSLFIASKGYALVENDYKGIEVSVSACYHKDQNFISYITTPGKDMHKDMAAQIYLMEPSEVHKDVRYGAKNKFVFPQFYGSDYLECTKNLWEWVSKGKLTGPDGIPLDKHLRNKGIKERGKCIREEDPRPGTFERHIQEVSDDFWNNRFMDYGKWRKKTYQSYLQRGYFDLYTGFRIFGFHSRNEVTNYPIQGSAFHCLLWCVIQIVNRLLPKYRMKARVVGQIHDSLIGDVPIGELKNYLEIVEETATVNLRKHWDWIIVPMEIEYEICPSDGTWFQKRETKFKKGVFTHPSNPDKRTSDPFKFVEALNAVVKEPKK